MDIIVQMAHHPRHLAIRVTIAGLLNCQVLLMNVKLDGTVLRQPGIRSQLITSLEMFALKAVIVLEEVLHRSHAPLVLFSTQLKTGIVIKQ